MLLSGSLAKGTALRSINDIDVACYISGSDAPHDVAALLEYLAERLRKAFPNFSPDQVKPQTYCVTVSFKGSGLDVDVVPILYDGDPQWYGNLVSQDDGSFLKTSIPLHLEFAGKRKKANETHYAQVVRLAKFWVRTVKRENENFRFKSFMVELLLAHLSDQGVDFSDYPEALQEFFTFIARSNMRERIVFEDYYRASEVGELSDPVQIIDPVNAENNASRLYTAAQADAIVDAALEAGDETRNTLLLATGVRLGFSGVRIEMSYSYTATETQAFTITYARHMAAKVATDLKRMQRFYGKPSDVKIAQFEEEVTTLLKAGYLGTVTYGFKRNGEYIEPTLRYTAYDLAGISANDDDPGKIRPGADISGATFYSYLTYSDAWWALTSSEKEEFESNLPFERGSAAEPGVNGYLSEDRTYSSGGRALGRASVRAV